MKCPNDQSTLVMTERSGVEIDYCPECRGVWLDRGELDKILDRAAGPDAAPVAAPAAPAYDQRGDQRGAYPQQQYGDRGYDRGSYDDRWAGQQQPPRRRKKENFLMELFGD